MKSLELPFGVAIPLDAATLGPWAAALVLALATVGVLAGLRQLGRRHLKAWVENSPRRYDDALVDAVSSIRPWFMAVAALWAGSRALGLPAATDVLITRVAAGAALLQVALWLHAGINGWLTGYLGRSRGTVDPTLATSRAVLGFVARVVLWSVVVLMVLDNLGFDITALVASLGIGGVAMALALQHILGDLLSSLAIALDKPVLVGDFVVLDDLMGTVEHVGLKTTRLRSLSGEQIVVSNGDLLSSRIRNYKRMYERRVVFGFGVTYQTSPEQLESVSALVRELIEGEEKTRFDRAHFKAFGSSCLEFEVVYFVLDPQFNVYMDIQQRINLALMRGLADRGVEFAYPTQTIHLVRPDGG